MQQPSLSSARVRLFLLVCLVLLPIALLLGFNIYKQRKQAQASARKNMERIIDFAVIHEEEILQETRQILGMLAEIPAVAQGGQKCNKMLTLVLKNSSRYLNFGVAQTDGEVYCSAIPIKEKVSVADRSYFRDALEKRSFSVGEYQVGRITGKPGINFGYPVLGRNGSVAAVVFAALDLSRVAKAERVIDTQTPPNSPYVKLDRKGSILSSYPSAYIFGKGSALEKSLFEMISREKTGTFEAVGVDGVNRFYVFSTLRGSLSQEGVYVLLGIPTQELFGESNRQLVWNLSVLIAALLLALTAIWIGGRKLIIQPVAILANASKRLAAGDLTARSGLPLTLGELGQLGQTFDEMAGGLEKKQEQILRRNRELSLFYELGKASMQTLKLEKRLDYILSAMLESLGADGIGIFLLEPDGETMEMRAHRGLSEEFVNCVRRIRLGEGVSGRALAERKPVVMNTGEYPTERLSPAIVREGFQTIVSTPLVCGDMMVGAANLGMRNVRVFPPEELKLLTAIGQMLGQAINNAQLYDNLQKEVDERKRMEASLQETRDYLENLIFYANAPIIVWDPQFRITRFNRAFERMTGRRAEEVIDSPLDILFPGDSREEAIYHIHRTMTGDRWETLEIPILRADGTVRAVLWNSANLHAADGRTVVATIAQGQDVTERKQAEETQFRMIRAIEHSAETIVITDTTGKIEYVNPSFERTTGYSREEAIGQNPRILKSGKQDAAFYKKLWETITSGETFKGNMINRRKDGSFYEEEATISPVFDSSGKIINYVAVKRDITLERELQRQVQTAQRMEAVGTLAGGIAHDFNNALTGVFGFGEVLRSQLGGNEEALSNLDEILRSGERAATLTRQLLTYSRRQIIDPVNLSLNTVVTDLLKLASKVVGEQIEIRTFLGKDLPTIHADVGQIEQVVMNLVLNARDAMSGGGQLTVESELVDLDAEYVRQHPYMRAGSYVVLSVSDTGIGMDQKTQDRVFEPFFTTKAPDKGSGLGLPMVYGIVKQHKGFIHLYSEPGKGTAFKIYFPPAEGAPGVIKPAKPSEIRGGTETILLAEDDESVRRLAERTLKDLGYTVLVTRDGEEAIETFRKNQEKISLALLDVVMPRKGGKEAYEAMHQINPRLKVLFMSGYTANALHESFVLITGVPFLAKPFGPGALARKVREVLDKR